MISNEPYEKRRLTYSHVWWNDAFSEEELDLLEHYCFQQELEKSTTVGETENYRLSNIKFIDKNTDSTWIFDKFNSVVDGLNDQYYNFNLYGYKTFQYTTYKAEAFGKYDWHMDTTLDHLLPENMKVESTRKLTLVMVLNKPEIDFTGGEFQLNLGREAESTTLDMPRGKIYAFPSFLIHRVKPVLTGVRKSIVIWVEGPKFV
jgi:PKHD-type hydroxylase